MFVCIKTVKIIPFFQIREPLFFTGSTCNLSLRSTKIKLICYLLRVVRRLSALRIGYSEIEVICFTIMSNLGLLNVSLLQPSTMVNRTTTAADKVLQELEEGDIGEKGE